MSAGLYTLLAMGGALNYNKYTKNNTVNLYLNKLLSLSKSPCSVSSSSLDHTLGKNNSVEKPWYFFAVDSTIS